MRKILRTKEGKFSADFKAKLVTVLRDGYVIMGTYELISALRDGSFVDGIGGASLYLGAVVLTSAKDSFVRMAKREKESSTPENNPEILDVIDFQSIDEAIQEDKDSIKAVSFTAAVAFITGIISGFGETLGNRLFSIGCIGAGVEFIKILRYFYLKYKKDKELRDDTRILVRLS